MQQPDNLKGAVPVEVEDYDPVPYFLSALPITLAVLGTQSVHEVAHRVVASTKKVSFDTSVPSLNIFLVPTCLCTFFKLFSTVALVEAEAL